MTTQEERYKLVTEAWDEYENARNKADQTAWELYIKKINEIYGAGAME